jgi:GrpB-like predicted nucleotidyltransferase (UPF0157 family)
MAADEPLLGLRQNEVRLVPYTAAWSHLYRQEEKRLKSALGHLPMVLDIRHVGSTSIPGMIAKPIIDMAIAVTDWDQARDCIAPIQRLGYEYRGEAGIPRRHYFRLGDPRTHHIHVVEISSRDWQNMLRFRELLIAQPELAAAYARLKVELARRFPFDRESYLAGKAPFIESVLQAGPRTAGPSTAGIPAGSGAPGTCTAGRTLLPAGGTAGIPAGRRPHPVSRAQSDGRFRSGPLAYRPSKAPSLANTSSIVSPGNRPISSGALSRHSRLIT